MRRLIIAGLFISLTASANAATIAQATTGASPTTGVGFFLGQGVTTPNGGPWDDISFNLVNASGGTPYALGELFLLTQSYSGTPATLSSATAGYLASTSVINGGVWSFSGVTLDPDTSYFLYENAAFSGTQVSFGAGSYAGGNSYQANGENLAFSEFAGYALNFSLTGDVVNAVPEPATLALLMGSVSATILVRRRRALSSPL
jgi:hypothetical protein